MSTSHCVITSPRPPVSLTAWKTTTSFPSSRSAPDLRAWKNDRDIWAAAAAEDRPRRRIDGTVVRRSSMRTGRDPREGEGEGESSRFAVPRRWIGRVSRERARARVVASSSNVSSDTTERPSNLPLDSYESVLSLPVRDDSGGSETSRDEMGDGRNDKGKERAHPPRKLKGRLPANRRKKEVEKIRRQEEVRLATERLITRENALLAIGPLEELIARENARLPISPLVELESGESSESVDDDSSDDENPPSIVEDVLLADMGSGTHPVRLNANIARSKVAVVVGTEPKQDWKASLKVWVRRVFCVADGSARKPRKLQKGRRE
ncbi:hypothetical protein OHC33_003894 [Knufia fluminis]|uniref:Uncharacterized protein n=1 Tax=Knufia fluminis TaxID=191047 RepID=A0AAN8EGG3_9EURO|nr:hypothetical protein OHC33_003894 [Knufia fluminis]